MGSPKLVSDPIHHSKKERFVLTYQVDDMTCGRCAGHISAGIRAIDPAADLQVDLGRHAVLVRTVATAGASEAAIREAGYSPVATARSAETAPAAARSGCCCGSGAGRSA
jgi:copper chaperone